MPEIKHVSGDGMPLHVTSDAHQFRWTYDSAWSTFREAQDRIKEIVSEGLLGRYHRTSRAHAVYKREKGKGRRSG